MSTSASRTRHTVTAVIVAHDGASMLSGLVRALATQTHQVERVVGVDTGSTDHSEVLLGELIGRDRVFSMPRDTGFGAAVSAALRHHAASRPLRTDPDVRRVEWIWLLHDDCEPARDALEQLLRAASRDRTVGVLGPKVLDGADRRTLRATGIAIDRAGRRVTGIEPGEIDQGQHDGNRTVLAVGSAGMLIRRDVWERVGGFDPLLNLSRDDIDFCWRAHGAGYRVQVVTDAVLYHRELTARRRRGDAARLRLVGRRNALYVFAVNLPLWQMLLTLMGCIAGSVVRIVWHLLAKRKDQAEAHAYAIAWLFTNPYRIWKGRRQRAAGLNEGFNSVRGLIPRGRTLLKIAEDIAGMLSAGPPKITGGRHHAVTVEEEDEQFVDNQSLMRRVIAHPCVQLVLALLIVALVAERRLLGLNPLGGGALVPAWGGASALWSEYFASFHAVGLGSAASAPPYLAVVAALATVLGGQAWLAVDVLLLGCVPLAGLTAYLAVRRLVTATAARLLLAASYAALPVAAGAIAAGHLGTAVAFIVLPLIAINAGRMLTAPPKPARRAAWATGLLVALAAAFSPVIWVLAAVLAVVLVVVRRWLWPVSGNHALIIVGTPLLVLFPWSLHLLANPSAFLAEAGVRTAAGTLPGAPALLMLSPGGPGLPPIWVTAGLGLGLVAAFLPHRHRIVTGTGWAVAAVGYLAAILVSRDSAGDWPGTALAVTAAGLLVAAAPAAQWLTERGLTERGHTGRGRADVSGKVIARGVLALAATAPVLAVGFWVTTGVRGPVRPVTQQVLPAFVAAAATSGSQYRTLVLRPSGGPNDAALDFTVLRRGDPTLGEPELTTSEPAEQALSRQVAALAAPDGADSGDPGQRLGAFGIHWVLLPAPVDQTLAVRLNASAGLVPLSASSAYDLWQVVSPGDRVHVIAPDGKVTPISSRLTSVGGVSAPASGGTLVLAEPVGGWTATLGGEALKPLSSPVDGWAQGFTVPSGGGTLALTHDNLPRDISLWAELVVLLVVGVLALPGKREDPAVEAEAIAAVRDAQRTRRLARARKTRAFAWMTASKVADSPVVQRALPGIVSGVATSPVTGVVGHGAVHMSRTVRLLGKLRRKNAKPDPLPRREPLALPAAPSRASSPATRPPRTAFPEAAPPETTSVDTALPDTALPDTAFPETPSPSFAPAESADEILARIMADVMGSSGPQRIDTGPQRVQTGPPRTDTGPQRFGTGPQPMGTGPQRFGTGPQRTSDRNRAPDNSTPPWDPAPPVVGSPPWEPVAEPPASAVSTWPTRDSDTGPFAARSDSPIPRAALERSDPLPALRERPELRERPDEGERPDFGTGPQPAQRPERGAHRAGRHGKPGGRRRRKDRGGDDS